MISIKLDTKGVLDTYPKLLICGASFPLTVFLSGPLGFTTSGPNCKGGSLLQEIRMIDLLADIIDILFGRCADIREMGGHGIPGKLVFYRPRFVDRQSQTPRTGIVVHQSEFPQVIVRSEISRHLS